MSIWQIIGLIAGAILCAIPGMMIYASRELARMEFARRDLEGVEIEGGWLFDVVNPERQQPHERSQQGNCEGRGVVGRVHDLPGDN